MIFLVIQKYRSVAGLRYQTTLFHIFISGLFLSFGWIVWYHSTTKYLASQLKDLSIAEAHGVKNVCWRLSFAFVRWLMFVYVL